MEALKLGMLMLSELYVILAQQQNFQGSLTINPLVVLHVSL